MAGGVGVAVAAAATLFTGPGVWATYADLVRGLGGTFTTGHNFAPGAAAHLAGASDALAAAVQMGSVAVAGAALLLLPVAWLVSRGRTWAAVIPLLGWIALFAEDNSATWLATASIPFTFFGVLALLLWEAYRERREQCETASLETPGLETAG